MIEINLKKSDEETVFQKNVLYKILKSRIVVFQEIHENGNMEEVQMKYCLSEHQHGIYANEFRSPNVVKKGTKTTDVLTCVVDEREKFIKTFLFDVKSNISAFSDQLQENGEAMLTVIKEVRDFSEQIWAEHLHKESFLLYYRAAGYKEQEHFGIVTKKFEGEKFLAAADELETLFAEKHVSVSSLLETKLKNQLRPYLKEANRLRRFARKKLWLNEREHDLEVLLLNQESETKYSCVIQLPFDD